MSSWAGPTMEDHQDIYLGTCQMSCGLVSNNDQSTECREKFCPNYVNYLITGLIDADSKPSLVSTHRQEVAEFCATWLVHLIDQIGWRYRVRLNLKECVCAAGKDCLVK
jgi:hypothetical protein